MARNPDPGSLWAQHLAYRRATWNGPPAVASFVLMSRFTSECVARTECDQPPIAGPLLELGQDRASSHGKSW